MLVRVLGAIEARANPQEAWVGLSGQPRVVLALLVADRGRLCRTDRLVQALWGEPAPSQAPRLVQSLISRLRRVVEPEEGPRGGRLQAMAEGWMLDVAADQVDALRLGQRVDDATALADDGQPSAARDHLEEAVGLWRGRPFGELADHPCLVAETTGLEERYLAARERLLRLRLEAGEPEGVVADAHQLVVAYPLRERLWAVLMEAQCRAGQPADALATYERLREHLGDELGTEPSGDLQALHTAILRQEVTEPADGTGPPTETPGPPGSRGRRVAGRWPCRRGLPLAGRDDALGALDDALNQARQGAPQLALVAGEPGIGKTRLVADFADAAAGEGVDVVAGRCTEGAGVPFQPVVEALAADVAATGDDALAARLGRDAGELARLVPSLAARTGWQPAPPSVSAELDQHRLFAAVAGWLAAAASQAPLVLVAEDLHAATRPTWLLLDHVVRTAGSARLLVVATYRDTADQLSDELADIVADWARRPDVTHLALAGLDQTAVTELLATQSGPVARSADWPAAVQAATGGNPLFIEELLPALATDPAVDPDQLPTLLAVPCGVGRLVTARLRRLASATTTWLDHAAVAGERFDFTETTHASDLTDDQALDAVDEATAARLIAPTSTDDTYAFTHAVTRDALLARLTPSRRMRLHARLATTLEAHHADDPTRVAGRLAGHHAAAGPADDPIKTRRYALAAGDQAMGQRAYDDAAAHYHHALQLSDASDREQRCDLLTRLGRAQTRAGHPDGPATLHQALQLAIALADPDRIVDAALAGNRGFVTLAGVDTERLALLHEGAGLVSDARPGPQAMLLALLGQELALTADLSHRRELADDALTLARHHDDPRVMARVLALRWAAIQHPATLDQRLAEAGELVDRARRLDDAPLEIYAQMWRCLAALEAGDRPDADGAADEALRLADEFGHPAIQTYIISMEVARELLWGDLDRAEQVAERYRALGHRAHVGGVDSPYLAQQFLLHRERGQLTHYRLWLDEALHTYGAIPAWQALASLAWALTGHHDRAADVLDRYAANNFTDVPHNWLWADTLCLFAETAAVTHQPRPAAALLDQLAPYHDHLAIEACVPLGAVAHYLGLLATTIQKWPQAEGYLDQAAAIHQRLGALRWHHRTLLARARLHLARNHPNDQRQADRLLHTVTTRGRQHGHTGLLHEAHALAASAKTAEPRDAPSSTPT